MTKKSKWKKKSGWRTPYLFSNGMKYNDIKADALESQPFYDDWFDWRDGMRDDELLIIKLRDKLKKMHSTKEFRAKKVNALLDKRFFWKNTERFIYK